ncbi:riboflavin transporter 2-like [Oscarella lobularis]|uniref:riboflavin transporter 2-like n=1 Tax=Oscarella lobularis TaxID=121494 RepID=UPI00331363DF
MPKSYEIAAFVFAALLGSGSWVAVNGVFSVSQPLWTRTPECYTLAAILAVAIQLGNIGAFLYVFADRYLLAGKEDRRRKLQERTIWTMYGIGTLSCVLLAFLWDKTGYIAGKHFSIALIVLTWCLALVDCTSTVTFLPYMGRFSPQLISALYVGEGFSGVIPAVLGLIQTQNTPLANESSYNCSDQGIESLRFSVGVYFGLLALLMLLSLIGFAGLNFYGGMRKLRKPEENQSLINNEEEECLETSIDNPEETINTTIETPCHQRSAVTCSRYYCLSLLLVTGWINFLTNGLLPPVSPYAYEPYGDHWSAAIVNIGLIFSPITAFISYWLPWKKILKQRTVITLVSVIVAISNALGGFVMWAASPKCDRDRPFHGEPGGAILMLLVNVVITSGIIFLKITLAKEMERQRGKSGLLYYGIATQVGSMLGAFSIIGPVIKNLFQPKSSCGI